MKRPRRGLLVAAAVVMVLSLGLPWAHAAYGSGTGFQSAARVTASAATAVFVVALRRRRNDLVLCAAGIAVLGVFIRFDHGFTSGRMAHLFAVALAVAGSGLVGRPLSRPAPPG